MVKNWLLGLLAYRQNESAEILDVLARNQTPIQVEIEKSLIRFKSRLAVRDKSVVITKPLTVKDELRTSEYVRIRWPGARRREMRLKIALPHFNLPNGNVAFICSSPDGLAMPRRKYARYDVSRYTNLKLEVRAGTFRVVDLSISGCRVAMNADGGRGKLSLGRAVDEAVLVVGSESRVILEQLIPRSQRMEVVGCEFKVKQDGSSPKILEQVLKALEAQELNVRNP